MRAIFIAFAIPATLYLPYALMRYSIGQKNTPDGEAIVYMAVDSEISKTFGWKVWVEMVMKPLTRHEAKHL